MEEGENSFKGGISDKSPELEKSKSPEVKAEVISNTIATHESLNKQVASQEGEQFKSGAEVLRELEASARKCAENLAHHVGQLRSALHAMSGVTNQYMTVHKMAADHVSASVGAGIEAMHQLLLKCQQMSEELVPMQELAEEIKQIKKTLDVLETEVKRNSRST